MTKFPIFRQWLAMNGYVSDARYVFFLLIGYVFSAVYGFLLPIGYVSAVDLNLRDGSQQLFLLSFAPGFTTLHSPLRSSTFPPDLFAHSPLSSPLVHLLS